MGTDNHPLGGAAYVNYNIQTQSFTANPVFEAKLGQKATLDLNFPVTFGQFSTPADVKLDNSVSRGIQGSVGFDVTKKLNIAPELVAFYAKGTAAKDLVGASELFGGGGGVTYKLGAMTIGASGYVLQEKTTVQSPTGPPAHLDHLNFLANIGFAIAFR